MIEDGIAIEDNVVKTSVEVDETAKTTAVSSKGKSVNDNSETRQSSETNRDRLAARQLRNFTYELHDVENVFTSKIVFFLEELNKQLNALANSNIYTQNKEKLDKVLKSKGEFRKELLCLLKTEQSYKDFYHQYYFEAKIFGNKAKYFRTVIEEYRRILLSRLQRQTVIDMIVKNPTITYQEVFNKLCELNERSRSRNGSSDYKFNWISKADFNNIIKQLNNLSNSTKIDYVDDENTASQQTIDVYAIDYSSEDDQISEFILTESEDKEYYLIEFKLKYSDYTTQSDSLLTYQCKIPKKQIKGLTTGYTKLKKFTRPRIFLKKQSREANTVNSVASKVEASPSHKLYISYNYELEPTSQRSIEKHSSSSEQAAASLPPLATDDTWQFKTMGIDIGVAKSATAAIMTTNMCWADVVSEEVESSNSKASSGEEVKQVEPERAKLVAIDITQPVAISNELTISDKTKSVSEHIEKLKNEQNYIYKKEQAIASLLKLSVAAKQQCSSSDESDDNVNVAASEANASFAVDNKNSGVGVAANAVALLLHKYQKLNKHRLHLRSKVSNLKKELSFLTARDMISHAIDNEVDLIALEKLSWISDADKHHTTWDYNQIQQRIIHEANIYGIKVKKVSCAHSSAHNPLTLEKEEVDQNRKLVKCLFDRDYAAAIILARRGIRLGKKKLQINENLDSASHINDSFQAVSCSIKPSLQPSLPTLQYRQLKLCKQKSIMHETNFAYYNVL